MKGKYSLFASTVFIFTASIIIFYEVIMHFGYLPLLTNSVSFDAKVYAMQKQQVKTVKMMALGSSITLDNISSEVLTKNITLPYYNFSSWGLEINDVNNLLAIYLPKYQPEYFVMCSSIPDFRKEGNIEAYTRYLNTNSFIKNHLPEFFYIRNYNPLTEIASRKKEYNEDKTTILNFDKNGGISRTIFKDDTILKNWVSNFNFPTDFTGTQYKELDKLGKTLKDRNIKFFFVQAPIQKTYMQAITNPEAILAHFKTCKTIVEKEGGVYLNYYLPDVFTDKYYADPFHLSGEGAKLMTGLMVKDMQRYLTNNPVKP